MVELSNFMGRDGFHWFIGVVEDRDDPAKLGRARVRCLGYHSPDVTELPTTDLPWAHVMHPVTDPCMHGMGNTPSFLVEGSYVVGFFRDPEKQQLVIMGTLPGVPEEEADPSVGFNNPRGKDAKQDYYKGDPKYGPYPVDGIIYTMPSGHEIGEPDTNRLAQGKVSETHNSLINRRKNRLAGDPTAAEPNTGTGIPTATKPDLSAVTGVSSAETRGFFEEPHPKSIESTSANYIASAHAYGIKGYVRGNVGPLGGGAAPGEGDVDINIVGNETHIVGKKITLHGEDDVFLSSNNNMAFITTNGLAIESASDVVSIKAGTAVDIRSTTTTTIEAGTSMDVDALAGGINIDATTFIDIDAVTISMVTTGLTTSVDIEATRIDLN
jgi:hypothetical protein